MAHDADAAAVTTPRPAPAGVRRRAGRRADGVKKQVVVPQDLWRRLEQSAARKGTTPNDLLVRLAERAEGDAIREDQVRAAAEVRWGAFSSAQRAVSDSTRSGEDRMPSADELVEASQDLARDE